MLKPPSQTRLNERFFRVPYRVVEKANAVVFPFFSSIMANGRILMGDLSWKGLGLRMMESCICTMGIDRSLESYNGGE